MSINSSSPDNWRFISRIINTILYYVYSHFIKHAVIYNQYLKSGSVICQIITCNKVYYEQETRFVLLNGFCFHSYNYILSVKYLENTPSALLLTCYFQFSVDMIQLIKNSTIVSAQWKYANQSLSMQLLCLRFKSYRKACNSILYLLMYCLYRSLMSMWGNSSASVLPQYLARF